MAMDIQKIMNTLLTFILSLMLVILKLSHTTSRHHVLKSWAHINDLDPIYQTPMRLGAHLSGKDITDVLGSNQMRCSYFSSQTYNSFNQEKSQTIL